ncbi:SagB family peptide dehydrogenase [Actinacidiphila paucisporea]|uniref:SagB-type dehydrogenase domain-containing protein n=1 Tax=Actinacidiphila paucisporea TaxID=310782 RepID=A0A1M7G6Z1_9ACTN|nr:SagB family peptide dehydrogenase [Actinacidiphila paucisporea]SHM12053.1 SagB-type dehydrogenase domain-containing protein [Actinacidiphila paucisporea]
MSAQTIQGTSTAAGPAWRTLSVAVAGGTDPAARARQLDDVLIGTVRPWAAGAPGGDAPADWYATRTAGDEPRLLVHLRSSEDKQLARLGERLEGAADGCSTQEVPYELDMARFGGPGGTAVAERLWVSANADVIATLRDHRSRARRLRPAADLLTASALAAGGTWRDAVQWLRGHTRSWARGDGLTLADETQARFAAEAGFIRNQADWLAQADRVRTAAGAPNAIADGAPGGAIARWFAWQSAAWGRLAGMEEAGLLHRPAGEVYSALVHATLHRQLGITAADEAYLAWLLSIALLDDGPREPFFADTVGSSDRRYHEQSKYFVFRGEDQLADESVGPVLGRQDLRPTGRTVTLPAPGARTGGPGLAEVLLARRSTHGRYQGTFSLDELSTLLHYSAGTASDKRLPGTSTTYRVRTYPSGGANYPIRLVMYCHAVEGVERGTYLYDPEAHALELLSAGDISPQLLQTSPWLDPRVPAPKATGKLEAADCPLWVFPVADLTHQRLAYGLRAYRLVLVECGHLAQNLSLVATWMGRSCIGISGYMDDAVNQLLDVDGVNSSVMYVYLIGDVPAEA